jgi:hypothetical protein
VTGDNPFAVEGPLLKKGLEVRNYLAPDVEPDLAKLFHEVPLRHGSWPTVGEGYTEADLVVHIHFGPSGGVGDISPGQEWCLLLQRAAGAVGLEVADSDALPAGSGRLSEIGVEADDGKPAVLVEIGKLPKPPEWVSLPSIPTTIRLQPLNMCLGFWVYAARCVACGPS